MTLDLQKYSVRTDLAVESREIAETAHGGPLPGIQEQVDEQDGIKVTRLGVLDEAASAKLGRMKGNYITIEVPGLRSQDSELQNKVAEVFADEFGSFLNKLGIAEAARVLIVGLGNWNVTPDALGPLVVENVLITRHYFELTPDQVSPGYRPVSAIAPGVMGITGIESSEVVQGIVDRTKPASIRSVFLHLQK